MKIDTTTAAIGLGIAGAIGYFMLAGRGLYRWTTRDANSPAGSVAQVYDAPTKQDAAAMYLRDFANQPSATPIDGGNAIASGQVVVELADPKRYGTPQPLGRYFPRY